MPDVGSLRSQSTNKLTLPGFVPPSPVWLGRGAPMNLSGPGSDRPSKGAPGKQPSSDWPRRCSRVHPYCFSHGIYRAFVAAPWALGGTGACIRRAREHRFSYCSCPKYVRIAGTWPACMYSCKPLQLPGHLPGPAAVLRGIPLNRRWRPIGPPFRDDDRRNVWLDRNGRNEACVDLTSHHHRQGPRWKDARLQVGSAQDGRVTPQLVEDNA